MIGYVWPEPKSSAAGSHMLSLLRLFKKQNWTVVFSTPAQKTEHMINLADEDIESVEILLNDSSFDKFVSELNPDLVLFDRFMMEEQFGWRVEQACPNAMRILDTEDLQCLRGARQHAHKNNRTMAKEDLFSDLAKREIAAILRSDLSLIISDFEMELLSETFKVDRELIHHLPFMLDTRQDTPSSKSFSERKNFVTIGNFRHAPNWDSVLFLQEIWPLIRKEIPEAELHIFGSYPPKKATALNNTKTGFLVKGWAEDAFEVLANARVCLAPLRFGAGIKGKLIDSMVVGTPSVTTAIGAEGMTGHFSWPGIVANTPQEIAQAAIRLYQNEEQWVDSQTTAKDILASRYNGDILGESLLNRITKIQENLDQHRKNNFTGAMLRHHTMKSTQFMSRWIETKTQLKQLSDKH
ncbi:glycosyltransferase [Aliikangiella coralliicola]|uniref:glycosyltransferase n=1 Tax=Aliikangiella coralliicola TaxID=2592383 RepID=UPI001FE270D9|nr:glycosyltransferase [Aliikangiella coralliicola]